MSICPKIKYTKIRGISLGQRRRRKVNGERMEVKARELVKIKGRKLPFSKSAALHMFFYIYVLS